MEAFGPWHVDSFFGDNLRRLVSSAIFFPTSFLSRSGCSSLTLFRKVYGQASCRTGGRCLLCQPLLFATGRAKESPPPPSLGMLLCINWQARNYTLIVRYTATHRNTSRSIFENPLTASPLYCHLAKLFVCGPSLNAWPVHMNPRDPNQVSIWKEG